MIRSCLLALSVALAPMALAQETTEPEAEPGEIGEGFNLMEEGAQLLLRGLMNELSPMMEDIGRDIEPRLRELVTQMGPMLTELAGLIDDLNAYHPPERLPNGDIILRRKTPFDDPEVAPQDGEGEQIDI